VAARAKSPPAAAVAACSTASPSVAPIRWYRSSVWVTGCAFGIVGVFLTGAGRRKRSHRRHALERHRERVGEQPAYFPVVWIDVADLELQGNRALTAHD
jgi:hypothetical protein